VENAVVRTEMVHQWGIERTSFLLA